MVAAAGAGGAYNDGTIGSGVSGGGLSVKGLTIKNGSYSYTVLDGTQTSGYKFGIGQDGSLTTNSYLAGSGGGYYTGYYNDRTLDIGPLEGIGGTSYISGHTGSVSIKASTSLTPKVNQNGQLCQNGTNDNYCSIHYSGKYFTDTKMIDGNGYNWTNVKGDATRQPTKDNLGTQTGNSGDGFIKITPITTNEDVYLKDIIVSDGTLNEAFNPLVED